MLAAAAAATPFVIRDQAGFVAGADLAHLDPRAIFRRELANQIAEVHSLFCGEVEHESLAAEEVFDGDEFHREFHFAKFFAAEFACFLGRAFQVAIVDFVLVIRQSQHAPVAAEGIFARLFEIGLELIARPRAGPAALVVALCIAACAASALGRVFVVGCVGLDVGLNILGFWRVGGGFGQPHDRREDRAEFHAAFGADHDLRARCGREFRVVAEFADVAHLAIPHHDRRPGWLGRWP